MIEVYKILTNKYDVVVVVLFSIDDHISSGYIRSNSFHSTDK